MIIRLTLIALAVGIVAGGWVAYAALNSRLAEAKADAVATHTALTALLEEQRKAAALADARANQDAKMLKQMAANRSTIREIIRHEPCASTALPAAVLERLR